MNRSGLPWGSGAYLPNPSPASVAEFGGWRGSPVDVAVTWSDRATWDDIVNPSWLYRRWAGAPVTVAFGVAMLPEKVPGVSLRAGADGAYNAYWRQFGASIAAAGLGASVIRLGWEFNGDWYAWQASDPAAFAAYWRQAVTSARMAAPGLRWSWDVNRGASAGLADPSRAWPGDAYADVVGVDSYDMWPPATSHAGWQAQLNGPQGLGYWLAFAKARGKLLAVPEWGSRATGAGGGDNPAYVGYMLGFFQANAARLAYESTFQAGGGSYGPGTTVPYAAAAYRAGWRAAVNYEVSGSAGPAARVQDTTLGGSA